jgi:hypothetical protein
MTTITTGVHGRRWRASVTGWGGVQPWDGSPELEWYVAADDRWHVPAQEPTVRQQRIDGTPVTETRVRVPRGDVVQTVYSCADAGGVTVIEVTNESTLPVAIAFDRRDLLTERPIADVSIQGIELPPGSFVLPLGHRARLRVGLVHGGVRSGPLPGGLPGADQVVRGWLGLTDRASRFVLPDGEGGAGLALGVTAHRCELALGVLDPAADDPVRFLIGIGELIRMGEPADAWIEQIAAAVEAVAAAPDWASDVALAAAARALAAAGERRAVADVERIIAGRAPADPPPAPPGDVLDIAWLEGCFARGGALFPFGFPSEWLGHSFEAHGVPTGPRSSVSLAVRWHGARPAALWEQQGEPVELSAPAVAPEWTMSAASGEVLWPAP